MVIDSHLRTPPDARLFEPAHGGVGRRIHIFHAVPDAAAASALAARGARLQQLPGAGGKVDLQAMIEALGQLEINELHVEAGFKLNGSLLRESLVDEFVVYLAPKLLGQGAGMFNMGPLTELAQGIALDFKSTEMVGPDLRIVARVQGRDAF